MNGDLDLHGKKGLLGGRGSEKRKLSLRTNTAASVYDFPILKDDCLISAVQNYYVNCPFQDVLIQRVVCVQTRELAYNRNNSLKKKKVPNLFDKTQ